MLFKVSVFSKLNGAVFFLENEFQPQFFFVAEMVENNEPLTN